ncbi:MAG: YwmB family TATA-box binding protein, partial [Firmicutes bacterium]|nr:YwmB family TATA-box binding protein [Bacillota bacterium]
MIEKRRNKVWLGICAILLVSVALAGGAEGKQPQGKHPVMQAFLASGARVTDTDLNSWGKVNNEFASPEQLRFLAEQVAAGFGLNPPAMKVESVQDRSFRQLQLASTLDGQARILILAQSVAAVSDGKRKLPAETYVVVRILKEGLMEDLASAEDHLRKNLMAVGHDLQTFICIHGVLPGKQSAAGRRLLLARMLNSISARMLT